ncbi:MAG TPA: ankyrin repeat domain-containing protein [Terriglobia bacterium]|nr:ankyrin repeat domain-containing protein [Terriglobia bacterium]
MWTRIVAVCAALCVAGVVAGADEPYDKLYSAIRANDLRQLKTLLDQGVSANEVGPEGITPLMVAAQIGSLDAMKLLVDRRADVNTKNRYGATALMWSVTDAKKVRLLLDRGADVNVTSGSGRTPLIVASFANPSAEVVRMLLGKGAKVAVMDQRNVTPLNAATFGNDTATIRLLLDASADVNTADTFIGLTPLMNASGNRNLEATKLLLSKGADVNAVSKTQGLPRIQTGIVEFGGWTPLLMSVPFGPPEIVHTLAEAGAKVNVQDYRGFSPLMLAAATDRANPETVRLLLARSADRQPKTRAGETAADWAMRFGDPAVMTALVGASRPTPANIPLPQGPFDVRAAVQRSVSLLERATTQFAEKGACFACHEQPAAAFAVGAARPKGIAVDEKAASERWLQITAGLNGAQLEGAAPLGGADNNLYVAEALVRSGYLPDRKTDVLAANLAAYQGGDGGWHLPGYARSPLQDNDFSRTAMAIRALKTYGTPGRSAEMKERIERAKQWLLRATPVTTEDFAMRLIGVAAAGSSMSELRKLAEPVLAKQRSDGGFAQRDTLASDAYATGMTLWALGSTGLLQPNDYAYRKGVQFLLATQKPDGSWHVVSRATKFQIYFESGFPHGHDQWISTMATGWAASALSLALD